MLLIVILGGCKVPQGNCTIQNPDGTYSAVLNCNLGDSIPEGDSDSRRDSDSKNHSDDSGDPDDSDSDSKNHSGDDSDSQNHSAEDSDSRPDSDSNPDDSDSVPDSDSTGDSDSELQVVDADGDGFISLLDCNDADPTIFPGATEVCDGVDNNCDGSVDEGVLNTFYLDLDGDGYGDPAVAVSDCSQPPGYVTDNTDCDDTNAAIHPNAVEDCAVAVDLNCDGSAGTADADGDGIPACEDCDDTNANAFPGGIEICDGVDNDCNAVVDDNAVDAITWYADADGDGYGDGAVIVADCSAPAGYASDNTDCDDSDAGVNPGAPEICDNLDNDCDGSVDGNATNALVWYRDADADGYGDVAITIASCTQPSGYVSDATDCNDADAAIHPGASEICNGTDDDCDGGVDDSAIDAITWYADADGDGFGDALSTLVNCAQPAGYVGDNTDCDDGDAGVYPGAPEIFSDGIDQDCDGVDGINSDGDGDGYDAVAFGGDDCDDNNVAINPGASEVCDGIDNDCDGDVDGGAVDAADWYLDLDGDGYGDSASVMSACTQPLGFVADATDCDDSNAAVYPGASEVCDGLDNDCDSVIDNNAVNETLWYIDSDSDGFGDASSSVLACDQPSGYVAVATDCDDSNAGVNPAEIQDCNSGVDQDCDGLVSFADTECGSGYFSSDNLFTTGGSWDGESPVGMGSVGNWVTLSGVAPGTSCATSYDHDCALAFTGPGSWSVTSDVSSGATLACVFSVSSNAASVSVNYQFGSVSSSIFAGSGGWYSEVIPNFSATGFTTLRVTVVSSGTLYVDSVICVE